MKAENKDSENGDLMGGATAVAHLWASSSGNVPEKLSFGQKARAYGCTALVGALLYLGVNGISVFKDKQQKKEALEAQKEYVVLEKLADVDKDGKISAVERALLYGRLDKDEGYGYMWYNPSWKDIALFSNRWDYGELSRIRRTIKEYENKKR